MSIITIPLTKPELYISFKAALNLRYPDEDTGDWHFESSFFWEGADQETLLMAGEGGFINTNPSLGDRGVRDMSAVLATQKILLNQGPVYCANHYRAIADLAMLDLAEGKTPMIATCYAINQWLDTEEQVQRLITDYLSPLNHQLGGPHLSVFEQWIATVYYD